VVAGEFGPYLVVPLLGALAVLCTMAIGAAIHSRGAGIAAAAMLATSPIFLFQIVQPMSDVPVTAWWTLATLFAISPVPAGPLAAGATAGIALLTRPNLLPLAIPIAVVSVGWLALRQERAQPRRLLTFAVGLAPAIGALLLLQWRWYGSPLSTGYGAPGDLFTAANIGQNLRDYSARLLTGETPALVLAALSLCVLAFRRSGHATSLRPVVIIWLLVTAAVVACYLPYAVFVEWWYLRFLLPALPFAFVLVGALLTHASRRLHPAVGGVMLLAALVATCSFNILEASRQQAFDMRRYEARYRTAGKYLDAMLPATAVVIAVQESSSARHYAHVPIVRWDLLRVDPEAALARLRTLGRRPFVVVEDWEAADLRARFPQWAIARLDWAPRANIGDDRRVLLFDPADRAPTAAVITDRVH
jgi:4-amino-4-deoxy-L-arabinose transferase-like glycosyltransferase